MLWTELMILLGAHSLLIVLIQSLFPNILNNAVFMAKPSSLRCTQLGSLAKQKGIVESVERVLMPTHGERRHNQALPDYSSASVSAHIRYGSFLGKVYALPGQGSQCCPMSQFTLRQGRQEGQSWCHYRPLMPTQWSQKLHRWTYPHACQDGSFMEITENEAKVEAYIKDDLMERKWYSRLASRGLCEMAWICGEAWIIDDSFDQAIAGLSTQTVTHRSGHACG